MITSPPLMDKSAPDVAARSIWPRVLSCTLLLVLMGAVVTGVACYLGAFPAVVGCMSVAMNGLAGPSSALALNVAQVQVEPCGLIGIRAVAFVVGMATLAWLNCELDMAYFGEWVCACVASSLLSLCKTVVHPLRFVRIAMRRVRLSAQTVGSFMVLSMLAGIALSGVGATEPSSKAGVAVLRAVEYANSGLMALPLPDATASRIRFAINENSAMSLNTTSVAVMSRKDVLAMAYDVGLNATANVKIGDTVVRMSMWSTVSSVLYLGLCAPTRCVCLRRTRRLCRSGSAIVSSTSRWRMVRCGSGSCGKLWLCPIAHMS